MTNTGTTQSSPSRGLRSLVAPFRAAAGTGRGLLAIATVAVVAGLWLNWGWLVAVGVAPLILAFLPCAAMCALGLCMMQMGRKGAAPGPTNDSAQGTDSTVLPRPDIGGSSRASGSDGAPPIAE